MLPPQFRKKSCAVDTQYSSDDYESDGEQYFPDDRELVMVVDYFAHCDKSTPVSQEVNQAYTLSDRQKEEGPLYAEIDFRGKRVKLQVDCGATVNVIPAHLVDTSKLEPSNVSLQCYNKTLKPVLGKIRLLMDNPKNGRKYNIMFHVIDEPWRLLLSRKAAEQMKLITVNYHNFKQVFTVKTEYSLPDEYPDAFSDKQGTFEGKVHLLHDHSAQPVQCPPRTVPISRKAKLKEKLDEMVVKGVITRVDDPTPWVNQCSIQEKKSGELMVCLDPRNLNKVLTRERYPLPTLDEMLPRLSQSRVFSKVDCSSGYWHCELDEESSLLTTFITPFGRFRYLRLPFGLNVSSEIFQRKLHQAIEGLPGVECIADDLLIHGVDEAEHDRHLRGLLDRCVRKNISLSRKKCLFRVPEVEFVGHLLTQEGLKPDPKKVEAVVNMPKPTDALGIQRLQGTVGYLGKFLPNLSAAFEPLRKLSYMDAEWQWSKEQDDALEEVKKLVTEAPVLAYYDEKKELTVECDASSKGLGAALLQDGKPLYYASRALTPTEQRYAQIEKECLAICFSLERFHQYTYGRKVTVLSDHKPLESIVRKPLYKAPPRLQKMMMRLLKYDIDIKYKKGKDMHLSDMLSRAFLDGSGDEINLDWSEVNAVKALPISEERLSDMRSLTQDHVALQQLKRVIMEGWPETKDKLHVLVEPYFPYRNEMTLHDGIIFRGERVVVPAKMRGKVREILHTPHLGEESTLRRARECLFWPNMSAEIKQTVKECDICRTYDINQQKETMMPVEQPERQFQKVAVDLFEWDKKMFQILVDYHSGFFEIDQMTSTSSAACIHKLQVHFARYGIPETVISDNGPQYASDEFYNFSVEFDFEHITISPHHSNANGKVEAAVKVAKNLLTKSKADGKNPLLALLELRNIPSQGLDSSPAQRFLNRRTRTLLPVTAKLLTPRGEEYTKHDREKILQRASKSKQGYDKTAKDLKPLDEGDTVRMKPYRLGDKKWQKGVICEKLDERSYRVDTGDGVYRRNRVHLRKTVENFPSSYDEPRDTSGIAEPSTSEKPTPSGDLSGWATQETVDLHRASEVCSNGEKGMHVSSGTLVPTPVRRSRRETKKPSRYVEEC